MQQINDVIPKMLLNEPKISGTSLGGTSKMQGALKSPHWKMVETLFLRFSSIYWQKWTSLIPNDAARMAALSEWHASLKNYSMEDMLYALEACKGPRSNYKTFPPTLGEFVGLCEEHREQMQVPQESVLLGYQQMPIAKKETAEMYLQKMKQTLAQEG